MRLGVGGGIRTHDIQNHNLAHYQLCYAHHRESFSSYQAVAGAANLAWGGGRIPGIIESMLTRYIHEAMKRALFRTLENGTCFGEIPGLAGVWANESTLDSCRGVLQEVLEEWLVLKIRDQDPIPRIGRLSLPSRAA